ncbi:MAG: PD40 domain-containing protein [Saprospiraceae bacterium]|nr:PD40 domain-containing protein [Pyrinomonadaceae bacterium]
MTQQNYKFEEFELNFLKRQLTRDGEIVQLNPKAFDLLYTLVESGGKLLSKDDLFRIVWDGQIVEESNLTVNMSAIRKALGERASQPRFITTVSGQGYRFVGAVTGLDGPAGTILESHTLARIVVEEETEVVESEQVSQDKEIHALPPAKKSFFERFSVTVMAAVLIVFAGIGGYLWLRLQAKSPSVPRAISMKRLTNLGNVTNAALSPDGKLFAYTLQEKDGRRSLWLGHVDGGSENINLLPATETTIHGIAFAPVGGSLFYILTGDEYDGGALFKVRVFGGAPEKIRERIGTYITFSPDGARYAFVRNDRETRRSSLIAANTGDANEREIASRALSLTFNPTSPEWSADGSRIAVSAVTNETTAASDIFTVAADGGSVSPLTNLDWNGVGALVWDPDGTGMFAVAGEREARFESQIWHISYPSGERRRIVSDLNVYGSALGLSSSGNELLVLQAQHYSNIWVAPAEDIAAAKQVTFELLGKKSGWDTLEWTPEGRIAYTAFSDTSETVWLMDADGKNAKQIIPDGRTNSHHSLSGDGTKMVFDSNRGGTIEIWAANADGSQMRPLTTGGNNSQPHISPDGKSIIYRSVGDGAAFLRIISADGGESTVFTNKTARWPRFSPDGQFVACVYGTDKETKLAMLNTDGEVVKLFDFPPSANFNNGIRWTPDGSSLTYRDWNNGIWVQKTDESQPARLENLPAEKLYSYGWSRDGKRFAFTRGTEIRDVVLVSDLK